MNGHPRGGSPVALRDRFAGEGGPGAGAAPGNAAGRRGRAGAVGPDFTALVAAGTVHGIPAAVPPPVPSPPPAVPAGGAQAAIPSRQEAPRTPRDPGAREIRLVVREGAHVPAVGTGAGPGIPAPLPPPVPSRPAALPAGGAGPALPTAPAGPRAAQAPGTREVPAVGREGLHLPAPGAGALPAAAAEEAGAPAPGASPGTPVLDDPNLSGAVLPRAAHLSLATGDAGAIGLHLRVRDGVADLRLDGPVAEQVEARSAELRLALAREGLQLGSLEVAAGTGNASHSDDSPHRGDAEPPEVPAEPGRPGPPAPRRSAPPPAPRNGSGGGRIHVEA